MATKGKSLRHPINVAVDGVVFGYQSKELFVLLVKQKYGPFKDTWSLPGGFMLPEEGLMDAIQREIREESGIKVDYLEQLYSFGDDIARDPRGRVISISYFALVNPKAFHLKPDTDASDAQWFAISKLPKLAYDHKKIIQVAKDRLKAKIYYQPIGFNLLDKEFPFSDLENLYTVILNIDNKDKVSLERRNFRKKILSFDFIEETDKIISEGRGRPGKLYKFNKQKYQASEAEGIHFEIKVKSISTV